jgi:hypothetical protein
MTVFTKGQTLARLFKVILLVLCLVSGLYSGAALASDARCSSTVRTGVDAMVKRSGATIQDILPNTIRPPVSTPAMMRVPCKSQELQRIANQFAYAPSSYAANIVGQINGFLGPVSGLMNNMFNGDIKAFMDMVSSVGGVFQGIGNLVQTGLSNLLNSIPGLSGSPFASALCGIMADTLLKYIQCEVPITMPSLGNITGSLNKLLPKGCAGDALRGALYSAAASQAFRPMNQSLLTGPSGVFSGRPLQLGPTPAPTTPTPRN